MGLLGNLGIDPKLLVAQGVNFAILVFLLHRLVYKPLLRRIEQDEQELAKGETEEQTLSGERETLQKERTEILAAAQERARNIVSEAQDIARGIRQSTGHEA
jgi:F-type H+-transporting ATPase subunit b